MNDLLLLLDEQCEAGWFENEARTQQSPFFISINMFIPPRGKKANYFPTSKIMFEITKASNKVQLLQRHLSDKSKKERWILNS